MNLEINRACLITLLFLICFGNGIVERWNVGFFNGCYPLLFVSRSEFESYHHHRIIPNPLFQNSAIASLRAQHSNRVRIPNPIL
jgi:hypothetical protein